MVDVMVGGRLIHDVGFLVKRNGTQLTDSKGRKTQAPAILSCNLVRWGLEEFIHDFGEDHLLLFECPQGIDPLYFSTLCVYFYAEHEKALEDTKAKVQRDVGINAVGVGDSSQGSFPSFSTEEDKPSQSEPDQPGSKKNPKLKMST